LWGHKEKIREFGELGDLSAGKVGWETVFIELEEKIEGLKVERDFSKLAYKIEIPKEGEYEIFIRNLPVGQVEEEEVEKLETNEWTSLGRRYFDEEHKNWLYP